MLALLLFACSDYSVTEGVPEIEISAQLIDHGEVVVGNQSTIGIAITNVGTGPLIIEDAYPDGTSSADFRVLTLEDAELNPHSEGELRVRYVPDGVGQDYGRIAIASNDPDNPLSEVDLAGFGVEPRIDVDPETLWFGMVEVGESLTRSVEIGATGSGTLRISAMDFAEDAADAYTLTLPEGISFPHDMPTGHSFSFDVSFSPLEATEWRGSLLIASNDPIDGEIEVALLGNTEDDPTENAAPVIEITDPDWGEYHLEGDPLAIRAVVYDEEDAPESLAIMFYANEILLGVGTPDSAGDVALTTSALVAGDVTRRVLAMDTESLTDEDEVEIKVWDEAEPIEYTLTGGATLFDYWTVDDDVTIYVDGVAIFLDDDDSQDTHPPVSFEASIGSKIRVVAEDEKACTRLIDPLTLHFGAGHSQALTDGICLSSCTEHSCYDAAFAATAVWPEVFLDETVTVSIP